MPDTSPIHSINPTAFAREELYHSDVTYEIQVRSSPSPFSQPDPDTTYP